MNITGSNGGGALPTQALHHPPFEEPHQDNPNRFIEPHAKRKNVPDAGKKRGSARSRWDHTPAVTTRTRPAGHKATTPTSAQPKPSTPLEASTTRPTNAAAMPGPTEPPATPKTAPKTVFGRTTVPNQTFAESVRKNGGRQHPPMYRDIPADAALLEAHAYCKQPLTSAIQTLRQPTDFELTILDQILAGHLHLDTAPTFLQHILDPESMALFSDQMRCHYGFAHIALKASMKPSQGMSSIALSRHFFPSNPSVNVGAVQECDDLRRDMHSCYLDTTGRKLIIQFNSKAKAARWDNRLISFLSQPVWIHHYRRPQDALSALDTHESHQRHVYCFRLLNVPVNITMHQVWSLLRDLKVGVAGLTIAQNKGTGGDDVNSYLVQTDSVDIPLAIQDKSRIKIGHTQMDIFHFQLYGNMPCRKCAGLEHQLDRCTQKAPQSHREIIMPACRWDAGEYTEIQGSPTFQEWQRRALHLARAREPATSSNPTPEHHACDSSLPVTCASDMNPDRNQSTSNVTQDCAHPANPPSDTTREDPQGLASHVGSTPAVAGPWPPLGGKPDMTLLPGGQEPLPSPRGTDSPSPDDTDMVSNTLQPFDADDDVDMASPALNDSPPPLTQPSPTAHTPTFDLGVTADWMDDDQLESPWAEQTQGIIPPHGSTTMDDLEVTSITGAHLQQGTTAMATQPTAPTPAAHEGPAQPSIDLTHMEAIPGPRVEYAKWGSLDTIVAGPVGTRGKVPGLGQCCLLALYCASNRLRWIRDLPEDTLTQIQAFKTQLRTTVATHQPLQALYQPRWLARLADRSKPTQPTLAEFVEAYYDRLLHAHPAQGISPADWGGVPEIAAAATLWSTPIYVFQEQQTPNTWWLFRYSYAPGDDDVEKTALPAETWTEIMAGFGHSTVVIAHRDGNHFDPLYFPPLTAQPTPSTPTATIDSEVFPLAPIFLPAVKKPTVPQPHAAQDLSLLHPKPPPEPSCLLQLPLKPWQLGPEPTHSTKLLSKYAKAATNWVRAQDSDLAGATFTLPFTTAGDLAFLLRDFPMHARHMLWTVGTPDALLRRTTATLLREWGQHMLLMACHHSMTQALLLSPATAVAEAIDQWRHDLHHAESTDSATPMIRDVRRWTALLELDPALDAVFNPDILRLSPPQVVWLAIVASLLDYEGIEADELPEVHTLAGLMDIAHTDNMLAIVAQLQQGRWQGLWPWVTKHAFAWGYTSGGFRE